MKENNNQKKIKKPKSVYRIFSNIFITLSVVGVIAWVLLFSFNKIIVDGSKSTAISSSNDNSDTVQKKDVLNILFCGENQNLTDTMMYIKYNVTTGKVDIMSIPRDTYVTSPYAPGGLGGHKLNSIYESAKSADETIKLIEGITNVKIDYYIVISNDIVRQIVDEIGGVEMDVPIKMKYDDPTQNLHINLKAGKQVLNGEEAEEFIRFRHNNDGTGYPNGDIDRIKAQQGFIRSFVATLLSPGNITKLSNLVNIIFKNTDTNMTVREALKYTTDISKIQKDNITSITAPGEAKYMTEYSKGVAYQISYFIIDKEKTQSIIANDFSTTDSSTNNTTDLNTTSDNTAGE